MCYLNNNKAANQARADAARKRLNADDDMEMSVWKKDDQPDEQDGDQDEAEGGDVALARVRVDGYIQVQIQKATTAKDAIDARFKEVAPDISTHFPDQAENIAKLSAEIATKHQAAVIYLGTVVKRLTDQRPVLKKAAKIGEINRVKTAAKVVAADMFKQQVKDFNSIMSSFGRAKGAKKRTDEANARKSLLDSGRKAAKVNPSVEEPTYTALMQAVSTWTGEALDEGEINIASSLHEAKLGFRAARNTSGKSDLVDLLGKNPYFKSLSKSCVAHMDQGVTSTTAACTQESKLKTLVAKLKKEFDLACFSTLPTPSQPWAHTLWHLQCVGAETRDAYAGVSHFGCCECRLLVSGEQIVYEMKIGAVPGVSLREKRMNVYQMSAENFAQSFLDKQNVWVGKLRKGDLMIIPSGVIVGVLTPARAVGLRWGVSGDENDTQRVEEVVEALLGNFPELRNPSKGPVNWMDFLKSVSHL